MRTTQITSLVSPSNMTTITLSLLLLCCLQASWAADFLRAGQTITGTSVVDSAEQTFVLGFFSHSDISTERYLGIWYNQSQYVGKRTVVWVANRDNPVVDSYGVFQIANDGNLQVTNSSGGIHWSSNLKGSSSSSSRKRTVKLLDSGNLVLMDGTSNIIWQSFQHPTDTFLPGMKMNMDTDFNLTSWSSGSNPRSGNYTFMMMASTDDSSNNERYVIWKNSFHYYWEKERTGDRRVDYMLSNFSMTDEMDPTGCPKRTIGHYYNPPKPGLHAMDNTRIVMNYTGQLQLLAWDGFELSWVVHWKAPASCCDVYNACGHFTSCNTNDADCGNSRCPCLPGFIREVGKNECARKSGSSCGEDRTKFLHMGRVKILGGSKVDPAENKSDCQQRCLKMCPDCQAYSYVPDSNVNDNCLIWTQDLESLQVDDDNDGYDLYVRVDKSDIETTPRICEPCGTNVVPYPLSTGPNCGDPKYFNFICNSSTAQLSFFASSSSGEAYIVRSIELDDRQFVIQVDNKGQDCEHARQTISLPFNVTNHDCLVDDKIEIIWQVPPEPNCNKSADCEDWSHSSCRETKEGIKRCLCDSSYSWDGGSLNCTKVHSKRRIPTWSIVGITLTGVVILAFAIIFAFVCRRKIALKKEKKSNQRNRERFHDSVRHVKDLIEAGQLEEEDNEGIEVPYFDFESILTATDNFSDANKLGKGGYGPVYKGKLQSGEVVAVKRLSSVSSQGLQEFKNEVVLIAKLQHRNLVRLRGYCIKGNEKILLYEYMHNRSLDSFIFDPTKSLLLDWQTRFDIILGIARGMLYLHQDSRLRVIHRDLKTSNILLNEEMQPKISDFGLAKIVAGKETEANTTRVVGSYGYMSPEYALDGVFSTKSDVFSFGVVVLEIISGKKNTGFYNSELFASLLAYAWTLWAENRLLDLMDISLSESCNTNQFIMCANIGLLCVQDEPSDRPTMSNVVTLLDSGTSSLPTPKEPTFFRSRGQSITTTSSKPEISTQFESSSQEVE